MLRGHPAGRHSCRMRRSASSGSRRPHEDGPTAGRPTSSGTTTRSRTQISSTPRRSPSPSRRLEPSRDTRPYAQGEEFRILHHRAGPAVRGERHRDRDRARRGGIQAGAALAARDRRRSAVATADRGWPAAVLRSWPASWRCPPGSCRYGASSRAGARTLAVPTLEIAGAVLALPVLGRRELLAAEPADPRLGQPSGASGRRIRDTLDPALGARLPSAGMPEDHFGEDVASQYDNSERARVDSAVIAQTVEFLAGLAARRAGAGVRDRHGRIALPLAATRHRGPRHRPVDRDGRAAAREAGRRAGWTRSRSATSRRRGSSASARWSTSSTTRSRT